MGVLSTVKCLVSIAREVHIIFQLWTDLITTPLHSLVNPTSPLLTLESIAATCHRNMSQTYDFSWGWQIRETLQLAAILLLGCASKPFSVGFQSSHSLCLIYSQWTWCISDLFVKLFTRKLNCYEPDNWSTWDWAVFYQNQDLWNMHSETVFRCIPSLPSSFRWAPRDLAKKINSSYKAWEYQKYIYGLGPTLFHHILPRQYWINFCQLVAGIHILHHHCISCPDILKGHVLLEDFVQEFKTLYY